MPLQARSLVFEIDCVQMDFHFPLRPPDVRRLFVRRELMVVVHQILKRIKPGVLIRATSF